MIRYLFAALLFAIAGCSTPRPNPSEPPTRPTPQVVQPPPQPVVIHKEPCNDGKFFFCRAQPIGSIRGVFPPPTSAISCGRCVDDVAHGPVLTAWCKRPDCKGADVTDSRDVYGHFIGEMSAGRFSGRSAILVTALGAYYGSLTPDGGYDFGLLKRSRLSENVFIGKFNPSGTPQRGVLIERGRNRKPLLKFGDFIDGRLEGFAYFYEDGAYSTMRCTRGQCILYIRDISKDQIKAVLDILLSEALENVFFQKPLKAAVLALLPKTDLVRDMERAYDAWGNVQLMQDLGNVLK
jgi:hypothetical protein